MPRTRFLSVSDVRQLIRREGLGSLTRRLTERLRADFLRWPEFDKTPRTANYSAAGVIELMPVSDSQLFAFKFVNGHPGNIQLGLPTVMGFGCLAEMSTGWPLMICEMTVLTAIRTAAASVLAAQTLANPSARSMAVIGNGAQSEFQVAAFHELLGIREFHLFDPDQAATQRLIGNLSFLGLELDIAFSVDDATTRSDIVTTLTADKRHATVLRPESVQAGQHINAVGGDCPGKTELHPDLLETTRVFVEFADQARIEGEIQLLQPTSRVTELWEVIAGNQPGRTDPSEITLFDSVGFAVEDFTALVLVYEIAQAGNLGSDIELVPELSDPKNLFGLIA